MIEIEPFTIKISKIQHYLSIQLLLQRLLVIFPSGLVFFHIE